MGISLTQPPQELEDKALAALDAIGAGTSRPLSAGFESGGAIPVQMSRPIPVYAPRTTPRASLKSAHLIGWRYLVADSDRIGAVDVGQDDAYGTELVADPSLAERIARASRAADRAVGADEYELRLLDLNFLGDSVLWLTAADKDDRFFSLVDEHREIGRAEIERQIRRGLVRLNRARRVADPEAGG